MVIFKSNISFHDYATLILINRQSHFSEIFKTFFSQEIIFFDVTKKKFLFKAKRKGNRRVAQTVENCHHDDTLSLSCTHTHTTPKSERVFSTKPCKANGAEINLKITESFTFSSRQNFKFAPIRKRFRDSGSALNCEQKCPPHHLSNPQGYQDTTN